MFSQIIFKLNNIQFLLCINIYMEDFGTSSYCSGSIYSVSYGYTGYNNNGDGYVGFRVRLYIKQQLKFIYCI